MSAGRAKRRVRGGVRVATAAAVLVAVSQQPAQAFLAEERPEQVVTALERHMT